MFMKERIGIFAAFGFLFGCSIYLGNLKSEISENLITGIPQETTAAEQQYEYEITDITEVIPAASADTSVSAVITENTGYTTSGTTEAVTKTVTKAVTEPVTSEVTVTESQQLQTAVTEKKQYSGITAESILSEMTLREKVYQMFIANPSLLVTDDTYMPLYANSEAELQNSPVGGIIYFAENISWREQCAEMISEVQSYSNLGMFIAVDEEGGNVARVGNNPAMGTTSFASAGTIGASGDSSLAYNEGYTIGSELAELGFNLDFAPVADVNSNYNNPVIGTRAYSSDQYTAAEMVGQAVRGFRDSGIMCTLKHFPGHGDTATDSHYGYAETTKTLTELEECEFIPFKSGIDAGAPFVMIGHISVPQVTGTDEPATLSEEIITGILREKMGYDGIVVTDAMNMQAITSVYSSGTAAVKAIQAGCDIVLMPSDLQSAASGVLSAVESGAISEERIDESVLRILSVKIQYGIIK